MCVYARAQVFMRKGVVFSPSVDALCYAVRCPVLSTNPPNPPSRDGMYKKMESIIQQLLAREAQLYILCNENDEGMKHFEDKGCKLIPVGIRTTGAPVQLQRRRKRCCADVLLVHPGEPEGLLACSSAFNA